MSTKTKSIFTLISSVKGQFNSYALAGTQGPNFYVNLISFSRFSAAHVHVPWVPDGGSRTSARACCDRSDVYGLQRTRRERRRERE